MPGSNFALMIQAAGAQLPDEPFRWSTNLDGVLGENTDWIRWGVALTWYCHKHSQGESVNIVTHSHGGQVVAYALAQGLEVASLVTVATPVRKEMTPIWTAGAKNLWRWSHIHSDNADFWQWMGARFSGWFVAPREMPAPARNIYEPGVSHSELLAPELWMERGWNRLIVGPGVAR